MNKIKFLIMKGEAYPGYVGCKMSFYDVIEIDPKIEFKVKRKYCYREFYNMGANAHTMRKDVTFYKKNIPLTGKKNSFLAKQVDCFQHSKTYFIFIPFKSFEEDVIDSKKLMLFSFISNRLKK